MTKNEFLLKFMLNKRPHSVHQYKNNNVLRNAAVVIPLIDDGKELHVLLTTRARHLKHHPGQVSFPGGKFEQSDNNLKETALRETFEEIGLPNHLVNIVGNLHTYKVVSGFEVTPFVAFIPNNYAFIKQVSEVDKIFTVPLKHFLNDDNHISVKVERKSYSHHIQFLPYKHYNIWGATAAMIKDLVIHLQ